MAARKLSRGVQAIAEKLAGGYVLCMYIHTKPGTLGTEDRWFWEPGGKPVSAGHVAGAFRAGLLRPRADGLFIETSQTYEGTSS